MKQKVVIISHSFSSRLALARSVGRMGCEVTLIIMIRNMPREGAKQPPTNGDFDIFSKYVSQVFYCQRSDDEGLVRLLLERCADPHQKVVIIPTSDFTAAAIDQYQERLDKQFLFPHINHTPGEVTGWMDKVRQKQLAQRMGISVVSATTIEILDGQYKIPNSINYPCFTKSLATISGGKNFLRRCNNEDELRRLLNDATRLRNTTILVEDFKKIDKEYAILGFSDGKQVVIPAVLYIEKVSESHFGVARHGQVLPPTEFEPLLEQFRQMLLHIGFVGLFDIDFYESDSTTYFSELNLRFGGSGYAVTKAGVNLPAMLVRSLRGENINDMTQVVTKSYTYVNERTCIDDWYKGYLSTRDYKRLLREADILFVNDDEDSAPQHAFHKAYRRQYFKRILKRFFK
jgi:predicted ATP-grasp superfamily ATP-dependent carboligase